MEEEKRRQEKRLKEATQEIKRTILSVPLVPEFYDPPTRVLTSAEAEAIRQTCLRHFDRDRNALEVLEEFVRFSALLSQPENHVLVATGKYVEKQVNLRPVQDMRNEMAQELIELPPFTAYISIVEISGGQQRLVKGKIRTSTLSVVQIRDVVQERSNVIDANSGVFSRRRDQIEEDIRQRQRKWLEGAEKAPGIARGQEELISEEPPPTRIRAPAA